LLDNNPISTKSLEVYYGINGSRLQRQYKKTLSGYETWPQKLHSENYLLYPQNTGPYLALDETALSNGELYTVLTNKLAKGKKGSIVAMIKGTKSSDIIEVLQRIPKKLRDIVREISLDMAASMNQIAKYCFTKAKRVTDRFHVQKLAFDAVQEIRIKHRWEAIDKENQEYQQAKQQNKKHTPHIFSNGDTPKQLLARSRYLLFKTPNKWTESQEIRAHILFSEYPDIKQAYQLSTQLSTIYNQKITKSIALTKMAHWFKDVDNAGFKSFVVIKNTFEQHYDSILNYFDNRSTNAYAESFNSKIKEFRRSFRGVSDIKFFLFRLTNIFA
jgi:transposase